MMTVVRIMIYHPSHSSQRAQKVSARLQNFGLRQNLLRGAPNLDKGGVRCHQLEEQEEIGEPIAGLRDPLTGAHHHQ